LLGQLFDSFVSLNEEAEEKAKKLFPEKVIDAVVEAEVAKSTIGATQVKETSAKIDETPAKLYNVVKNNKTGG